MDIFERHCTPWIRNLIEVGNVTTNEINHAFSLRNLPGILFVSTLSLLGISGNFLVIWIFGLKFNQSSYRIYVLCLAVLDFINCFMTMPFVLTYLLYMENYPSELLCKIGHLIGFFIGIASPFTLILIAADRYRNVCRPLSLQWSARRAKLMCLFINIVALFISWYVPIVYGTTEMKSVNRSIVLVQCFKENGTLSQTITWWQYIILTGLFTLVSAFLIVIYLVIMINVRRKSKLFTKYNPEEHIQDANITFTNRIIHTKKATVTFFIISSVYVLSSLVHHVLALFLHVVQNVECKMSYTQSVLFWSFFWTVFINNVANPVIYGLSDTRFKQCIKSMFSN
ncbi:kappa-type opioid receptor-like [Mytilus trossulus]|uniref:kappa-type opioid receptor-like n=1 Tax=Mytilus trossulus TaxID=6551 RepID=UPI0030071615